MNAAQTLEAALVSDPRIQSTRDGDQVRVEVCDNGPGIPADNIARLFEPFFTTKKAEAGTGLGLAISAEIVKRHGGRIDVHSVEGTGARFSLLLPAVKRGPTRPAGPAARRAPS